MVRIREMTEDWPAVEAIYAEGIATRDATFETEIPTWAEFDVGRLSEHRLVALEGDRIVGWAALSATSARTCYAGVVEHSVYVSADARRKGVGTTLLEALIGSAEAGGIWTIQTSVFPENEASRTPRTRRLPSSRTPRGNRATRCGLARHDPVRAPLTDPSLTRDSPS